MKFVVCLLIFVVGIANAETETENQKIARLMEALGLVEMWQEQIELGQKQAKGLGQQALRQMMSNLNPSEEFRGRFASAFNVYLSKLTPPWTAQDIVDQWASIYGPNFTAEELDKLIEFYTSELGKKDITVTKNSMTEFSNYYQEQWKPIMENATAKLITDLRVVAKECNCVRREP